MELDIIISLVTLTFMEIVLGIDNIIFISITADKLPLHQQAKARTLGIALALLIRVALLFSIAWIVGLTEPVATVNLPDWMRESPYALSWRDIILFAGGLFLLAKSTTEIHGKIEGHQEATKVGKVVSLNSVILQIILLDVVFSFDSILTAVGLVKEIWVMVVAVIISMVIMLAAAGKIAAFINKHPTVKILALSFLLLIGFMLVIEGLHFHVPKGYIYFAIFFSLFVEVINMRVRKNWSNPAEDNASSR